MNAIALGNHVVFVRDDRGWGDSDGGMVVGGGGSPDRTGDVRNAVASVKAHADIDPRRVGTWGHSLGRQLPARSMRRSPHHGLDCIDMTDAHSPQPRAEQAGEERHVALTRLGGIAPRKALQLRRLDRRRRTTPLSKTSADAVAPTMSGSHVRSTGTRHVRSGTNGPSK